MSQNSNYDLGKVLGLILGREKLSIELHPGRTYPFDGVLEFRKLLEFTGRSIGEVLETPERGKHVPVHEGEPSWPERQNKLKIYKARLKAVPRFSEFCYCSCLLTTSV